MKGHPLKRLLQDYFEDELGDKSSEIVRRHLEKCNSCSKLVKEMAEIDVEFKRASTEEISTDVRDKIFSRAEVALKVRRERVVANKLESAKRKDVVSTILDNLKILIDVSRMRYVYQVSACFVVLVVAFNVKRDMKKGDNRSLDREFFKETLPESDSEFNRIKNNAYKNIILEEENEDSNFM